jgi:hypothetical protein
MYKIILGLLLTILLCGCVLRPPGCIHTPFAGGCSSKAEITDVVISPASTCISIDINRCNGFLMIHNGCSSDVLFRDYLIKPNETVDGQIIPSSDGDRLIFLYSRNEDKYYSVYQPVFARSFKVNGTVGNQSFTLSYIKTGPLC